ncbi:MAG: gliding motility-associated C-terminal domain-containing protein [Prevotellaceae bacterium]|jgi:hypothetical protein|nr:gliding motility-associated C-terminal domain-containing protein [Prevotellaceae bacterium]
MKIFNTIYKKSHINRIFCLFAAFMLFVQIGLLAQTDDNAHKNHQHHENACPKCDEQGYEKCVHDDNIYKDYEIPPILYVDPSDPNSNNTCNKFVPFCGDGVMKFETTFCKNHPEGSSNVCSVCGAQAGYNYGCLSIRPRPAWFCMRVDAAGRVDIRVQSSDNHDIDIAIWGPFDSPTEACANYFYYQSPVACSYLPDGIENMTIWDAVAGKYYMMVITNFRNILSDVDIIMTNAGQPGAGKLSCDIVYECSLLSISTNIATDSCSDYYNVSGVIDFTNAPDTSRLCIVNTALLNDTFYINPPFSALSEYAYFFNDAPFDSLSPKIIAWFETDTACYLEQPYLPVRIAPSNPVLTMPPDVVLYADAVCYADTSILNTGIATIVYNACLNDTNTIIIYSDSVYVNSGTTFVKRKWTGRNIITNQQTVKIQTISIRDTVKPVLNPPNDTVVYKNNDCYYDASTQQTGYATANDNCAVSEITYNDNTITDTLIIREWTVKDESGNIKQHSQKIILSDTIVPEITKTPSSLSLECDGGGNVSEIAEWLAANGGGEARDCSPEIVWTNNFDENNFTQDVNCASIKSQTVTFTVTDAKGNFTTRDATITINDTQKPYFETYPSDLVFRCDDDSISEKITEWLSINGGFSAMDICSGNDVIYSNNYASLNFDPTPDCHIEKTATVSFMASDLCGNILSITSKIQIKPARANSIIVKNYEHTYGDSSFIVMAISTSYLPVTLNVIDGTSVNLEEIGNGYYWATIQRAGTTTIEATQNGNADIITAESKIFTVTINPALLKISFEDKIIKQADAIPEFLPIYKGFVYGETDTVLIQRPVVFCAVTMNSAPGKYLISAFSAYAENYTIEYINATLEILADFPNAITPYNNDGLNDIFAEGYKIKVFNRNGQLMYEGDNGWNGVYRLTNKQVEPGVYYYVIFLDNRIYRGSVTLVK